MDLLLVCFGLGFFPICVSVSLWLDFFLNKPFNFFSFFKSSVLLKWNFCEVTIFCWKWDFNHAKFWRSFDSVFHFTSINKEVNDIYSQSEFEHWVLSKTKRVDAPGPEFGLQLVSTYYFHSVRIQTGILATHPLDCCFSWHLGASQQLGPHYSRLCDHVTEWRCHRSSRFCASPEQQL